MNWNSPCADEVEAPAVGLKSDSILAVASRYSKLVPVVVAACLIAPATRTREGSTPAVAVAFKVSTAMCWCPAPRETTVRSVRAPFLPKSRSCHRHTGASMVNGGLRATFRAPDAAQRVLGDAKHRPDGAL